MKPALALLLLVLVAAVPPARAGLDQFDFTGAVEESRFRSLVGKLRCLVCQNESLLASNAELANDLRTEIYEMMRNGRSDEEIVAFLVARYGDFVLYDPPLKPGTYFLWFAPAGILLAGALMITAYLRRRSRESERTLDSAARERLAVLLDDDAPP